MRFPQTPPYVRRTKLVLATTLLLCSAALAAQSKPAASRISADDLMTWVRNLSSPEFEGRRSGTPGNMKARAIIANRLRTLGITSLGDEPNTYIRAFRLTERNAAPGATASLTDETRGANIVGLCKGTGPASGPAMVISAHYDHLGVRDGQMYPGADDNASGVATVLRAGRALHRHTVDARRRLRALRRRGARTAGRTRLCGERRRFPRAHRARRQFRHGQPQRRSASSTSRAPRSVQSCGRSLEPIARRRGPIYAALRPRHDIRARRPDDDWTMQSDHGAFHAGGHSVRVLRRRGSRRLPQADRHRRQDRRPSSSGRRPRPSSSRSTALDRWLLVAAPVSTRPRTPSRRGLHARLEALYDAIQPPHVVTDPIQIVRRFTRPGRSRSRRLLRRGARVRPCAERAELDRGAAAGDGPVTGRLRACLHARTRSPRPRSSRAPLDARHRSRGARLAAAADARLARVARSVLRRRRRPRRRDGRSARSTRSRGAPVRSI